MTIGEKIKYNRIFHGWSQRELSSKLAVSVKTIGKWEQGNIASIPLSTVQLMAELFNIAPSFLIEDDNSQK